MEKKLPNGLGLYDITGNVWDWHDNYPSAAQTDPTGASSGTNRMILRGGFGKQPGTFLYPTWRHVFNPSSRNISIGFRLVRPAQ